ncbi:MAG: GntR family transcriptional regulator [Lachnospiraceae bacterium]|nr:GntR family transcriptional regulator [Lachnospiraceae bacterium]
MIQINYQDKRPIYEQVVERFRQLIVKGILKSDDKMPSVRNLAIDLSINPNTIQKAYQELERQGLIYTVKGRGNFVSAKDRWIMDASDELLTKLRGNVRDLMLIGMEPEKIRREVDEEVELTKKGSEHL